MATKIVINIESLRGVASNMRTLATQVEGKKDTLYSRGSSLDTVGTDSLSTVADDVQSLKDHATALDARVDLAILHNSGDGKNVPETGNISYTVEGEDSAKPEDVERELGVAIANLGEDIATSEYQEGDPRVELLRSKLLTWNANTNVMGATFDSWGPEGTLAVTTAVGEHLGLYAPASDAQSETARRTLELVKSGLGTATQGWSDAKAEQFGRDMVDVAVEGYNTPQYQQHSNGIPPRDAMAYIAYENTSASGAFILGAMEQVSVYETGYYDRTGHEASSVWGYSLNNPPQFLEAAVGSENLDQAMDVPANLLGDLANHPEESFRFFNEDHERAEYWVIDRKYKDDFNAVGEALAAASTDAGVRYNYPSEAAEIAALAINGLGMRTDFGEPGKNPPGGMGAADSVGQIVSTYVEGMNRSATDDVKTAQPWEVQTYLIEDGARTPLLPKFDRAGLGKALNVIGRDGGAFLELRQAQNSYQEEVIRPGMTPQQFKDAAQNLGKVEGFVARTIGTGEINDAQAHDAQMKAWIELGGKAASEIASIGASYAPPGVGTAISWGSDKMINDLAGKAEATWANTAAGEVAEQNRQAEAAQAQFVRSLLMSADADGLAGYQNGDTPLAAAVYKNGHLEEGNPAAVENPDGTFRLMTRQEYDAMASEVQNMTKNEGETDAEFNARKEAAQKKLKDINSDLHEIAGVESGYRNMVTVGDVESAYKGSFVDFYDPEKK